MNLVRTIAVLILSFLAGLAAAQEMYNSIEAVRSLSPEEAAMGHPVEIESQIVWVDDLRGNFFLNDGEFGIYVKNRLKEGEVSTLMPGAIVRLRGITHPGNFSPNIIAQSVAVLGQKSLPEAKPYWNSHLVSPEADCDWLAISGRLISFEVLAESSVIVVELVRDDQTLFIQVPLNEENESRLSKLMFQWVSFNAVASTVNNENRQSVGRIFHVSSASDFKVEGVSLNEALSAVKRAQPIHELMQEGMNPQAIVKTYGTVSYVGAREIFLRGEQAALKVWMQDTSALAIGDEVDVVGLVWPEDVTPAFRAHSAEIIRKGNAPTPVKLEPHSAISDTLNYDVVQVDAKLIEIGQSFGVGDADIAPEKQVKLLCRSGNRLFEAQLPAGDELPETVKVGARIQLTGLCHIIRDNRRPLRLDIGGFWLQLRDRTDIDVLVPAPWWTTARLLGLVGITLSLSLLFLIWIVLLRKTVERQTGVIGEKVEREAIHNERQRIARELHDNLEQGLAGAIFQLGGFRRLHKKSIEQTKHRAAEEDNLQIVLADWQQDAEQNGKALEAVEHMLRHCSEESRSSILDLRGGLLEKMDLIEAVNETLRALEEERHTGIEVCVKGQPKRLSQATERNLLLVIKEAASNATRHASANRVEVELDWTEGLRITVSDDGCGFNVEEQMAAGRFGLLGMQERLNSLNGTLRIESAVDAGTTIIAALSLLECREV